MVLASRSDELRVLLHHSRGGGDVINHKLILKLAAYGRCRTIKFRLARLAPDMPDGRTFVDEYVLTQKENFTQINLKRPFQDDASMMLRLCLYHFTP